MPVDRIMQDVANDDDRTLADKGFYWREHAGVKVLVCRELEQRGFINGFSTRLGGVSPFPDGDLNLAGFDEDAHENIAENRRRFLGVFGGDLRLATAWQVHGANIKQVAGEADIINSEERADALVSDLDGVLVGVKTADCVPVLFGDPAAGAFAAVHAGWRGTAESIAAKAVMKLVHTYGTRPENLICAIGPAACGQNYEIGPDVIEAFSSKLVNSSKYFTPTHNEHALVDLHEANRDQLTGSGVPATNVFIAPFCTMERPDLFFSYRMEKRTLGRTGRLLSVVGRPPTA